MLDRRWVQEMCEAIRTTTDEEMDEIMAQLQREGIIDENWQVLKRMPAPPWKREVDGETKKPANSRERKPRRRSAS
jgi:hypothetical protein